MAGRGFAPKDTRSRERDQNRRDAEITVVQPDGAVYGPDLPETFAWPDATREWWATWRASGLAQTFIDTDWSFLLDTAILHAEFWLGNVGVAGELRLRVAKYGATPEDRSRLKLEVGEPPTAALRPKSRGRRERLLKAVGGEEA